MAPAPRTPHDVERVPKTPAVIYDVDGITARLRLLQPLRCADQSILLYSVKAMPAPALLQVIRPWVDGFSVSSLFEARLAREVLKGEGGVHVVTPGIRPDEIGELSRLCTRLTFNSLGQLREYGLRAQARASIGLRIHPGLEQKLDPRFDPCRPHSKLGVRIDAVLDAWPIEPALQGLHVHCTFDATDCTSLTLVTNQLENSFGSKLATLQWLNLGGGLLLTDPDAALQLKTLAHGLHQRYGLQTVYEPGKAIVGAAGSLVATVIDTLRSDGLDVLVMDTTVNHMPRVFEYQYTPAIAEATPDGDYQYLLAGASCLAGDLFGVYRFAKPLRTGSRVTFLDVGAYMMVKASYFNGINLPDIYLAHGVHDLELIRRFDYDAFNAHWR